MSPKTKSETVNWFSINFNDVDFLGGETQSIASLHAPPQKIFAASRLRVNLLARIVVCIFALFLAVAESPAQSSGAAMQLSDSAAAFDRSTAELAAGLVLDRLQSEILDAPPDIALLSDAMTAAPQNFIDPDDARKNLETVFVRDIVEKYNAQAGKLIVRLSGEKNPEDVFDKEFLMETMRPDADKLRETVAAKYPDAFAEARKKAVAWQSLRIVANITPTEKEFEDTAENALAKILTDRIAAAQTQPVFKENLAYISDALVAPILAEAKTQRAAQNDFLAKFSAGEWLPGAIENELKNNLAKFVDETQAQKKSANLAAFGIFPSVAESVANVATQKADAKIANLINSAEVEIDADSMLREINASPEKHVTLNDSVAAFAGIFEERLQTQTVENGKTHVAEKDRAEFEKYLRDAFARDGVKRTMSARVNTIFLPKLTSIRDECAALQLRKLFARLADKEWFPSGALVDAVCEQTDYAKAVRGWREFAEMEEFAKTAEEMPLMEETGAKLDAAAGAVFDIGRNARTAQHGIVNDVYDDVKRAVEAETKAPDIAAIVALYAAKVVAEWDEKRDAALWGAADAPRPKTADTQHKALFPSTETLIELKAKTILEALEKDRQKEQTPEIVPEEIVEEEPTESENDSPEELELIELNCRFELDQKGRDIIVHYFADDNEIAAFKCPHAPGDYVKNKDKTLRDASAALMKSATSFDAPVAVTVDIHVRNGLVYHGLVNELQKALSSPDSATHPDITITVNEPVMP